MKNTGVKLMAENLVIARILLYFDEKQAHRTAVIRQILGNHLTMSSMFWGMCYGLLTETNTDPELGQKVELVASLAHKKGWLKQVAKNTYVLTPKGADMKARYLAEHKTLQNPELFSFFNYRRLTTLLHLCIQVASEKSYQQAKYQPLTLNYDILQLFKRWYQQTNGQGLDHLAEDLEQFLSQEDTTEAVIFAQNFAGYHESGFTTSQLAQMHQLDISDVALILRDLTARFIFFSIKHDPTFGTLFKSQLGEGLLTKSALKSYQLFQNGYDLPKVAQVRRLKLSTVIEHILNCAMILDDFPYQAFLLEDEIKLIEKVFQGQKTLTWNFHALADFKLPFYKYRLVQIMRIKIYGTDY